MFFSQFRKGFTLVELMVIMALIGILAAGIYPSVTGYLARGRDSVRITEIKQINTAIAQYQTSNRTFRVPGTGTGGTGQGWVNYNDGGSYSKSVITGLQEKGFMKNGIQNLTLAELNTRPVVQNTLPCVNNTASQDLYMLYFDDATGKYSISGYLENQLTVHMDSIKISYNSGTTCGVYGRNYALGIN